MTNYKQGLFTPKHPEKYVGDVTNIVYRSSWELEVNEFLDNNVKVLRWASEEFHIPYLSAVDGKMHKYYPDYWVEFVNDKGQIVQEVLECKPKQQVKAPRGKRKMSLYEQQQYARNISKWTAAEKWCADRGMTFRIITEKSVFK